MSIKASLTISCLFAFFLLNSAECEALPDLNQEYLLVLKLRKSKNHDAVIEGLKRIIDKDINFDKAYTKIVEAYKGKKALAAATEYMQGLIARDPTIPTAHYGLGLIYREGNDHEKAAEELKRSINLKPQFAAVFESLAASCKESRKLAKAIEYLEGVIRADPKYSYAYFGLGYVYSSMGEKSLRYKGMTYLEEALRSTPAMIEAYRVKGEIYLGTSRFQEALKEYETMLIIAEGHNDSENKGIAFDHLGIVHNYLGNYPQALDCYRKSLKVRREVGDKRGEAGSLHNIGGIYRDLGEYQQALDYCQKSLKIYEQTGNITGQGYAFNSLGLVYGRLGNFQQALDYYQKSLKIFQQVGHTHSEGWVLNNIGFVNWTLGNYEQALDYHLKNLELRQTIGDRHGEGTDYNNIGSVYRELGKYQLALEYYRKSLMLRRQIADKHGEGMTLINIGDIYTRLDNSSKGIENAELALRIGRMINNPELIWRSHAVLANALVKHGALGEAFDHCRLATETIEQMREKLHVEEYKTGFLQNKLGVYEKTIDVLSRLHAKNPTRGYDKKAFGFAEKAKARAFLDLLAESRADIKGKIDRALLAQEKDLQRVLSYIQTQLRDSKISDQGRADLLTKLRQASENYEAFIIELRHKSPAYADLKYPQPYSLEQTQANILDEKCILVEFFLGEENSFLWVVTKTDSGFYLLPNRKEIEKKVEKFLKIISNPHIPLPYKSLGEEIFQMLFADSLVKIGEGSRLVIVPDGILHTLPFETLLKPGGGGRTSGVSPGSATEKSLIPDSRPRAAKYLIEDYQISYAPSASVLKWMKKIEKPHPMKLLAFGDPVFTKSPKVGNPGAKRSGEDLDQDTYTDDVYRSWYNERGLQLNPLPYSREEVEGIAKLYPANERALYLGEGAKEEVLKALDVSRFKYVHFATHGLIDDENPRMSGLVLTLAEDPKEDGFLQMNEIFDLNLNSDMVALSACKTGLGKMVKGEGIVGLTRAFMYAGSSAVLVSLWNVGDRSTSMLMQNMYKYLNQGKRKAEALRDAKLELIRSKGKDAHPSFWGPFVLIGDNR